MHPRDRPVSLFVMSLIIFGLILASGCAQPEDQRVSHTVDRNSCTVLDNLPHNGSTLLFNEARRQLNLMNSSEYTHSTYVDEENGTFNYDCSGFVGYALSRADPCAYRVFLNKRPDAGDFYYQFLQFGTVPGSGGWMRVSAPMDLRAGDIIVWLKPDSSDSDSTGHIMIVSGSPIENPEREDEVLVRVIDSTTSRHTGDTRSPDGSGLGEGIIGIMTDSSGKPLGYYWRGGESRTYQETEMAFARIV